MQRGVEEEGDVPVPEGQEMAGGGSSVWRWCTAATKSHFWIDMVKSIVLKFTSHRKQRAKFMRYEPRSRIRRSGDRADRVGPHAFCAATPVP